MSGGSGEVDQSAGQLVSWAKTRLRWAMIIMTRRLAHQPGAAQPHAA